MISSLLKMDSAKRPSISQLSQLKKMTIVVADTGDFHQIEAYKPQDSTTNPSLILQAAKLQKYSALLDDAVQYAIRHANTEDMLVAQLAVNKVFVNFGVEILKLIHGRVSTEVDARLSFDTVGTVAKGRELIRMFEEVGVNRERILLKIAATWEGIQAARQLEAENIHCNITLLFCLAQAHAAAEAGVTIISPFVGRILDWFRKNTGKEFEPAEDPGVCSVRTIYEYFKSHGYNTTIMGASFRSVQEVQELAGCDFLTIAPKLLKELDRSPASLERRLIPPSAEEILPPVPISEAEMRWQLNEDAMATEKLAEGIRKFTADIVTLEEKMREMIEKLVKV